MNRRRARWGIGLLCAAGLLALGAGAALGSICDGWTCQVNLTGCLRTEETRLDTCCVDLNHDGIYHCTDTTKRRYQCPIPEGLGATPDLMYQPVWAPETYGAAYQECHN